jgi:hypothetical protein
MKQTGFEWAAPSKRDKERQIDIEIDPETRAKVVELMARAMLAVLAAVEVTDDER